MDAWEAAGPGAWRRGRFGIQEPDPRLARAAVPGEIEVVLVPCVGFDRACRRLGRGEDIMTGICRDAPGRSVLGSPLNARG